MPRGIGYGNRRRDLQQPGKTFIGARMGAQQHQLNQALGQQNLETGAINQDIGRQNLATGQQNQMLKQLEIKREEAGLSLSAFKALVRTSLGALSLKDPAQRAQFIQKRAPQLLSMGNTEEDIQDLLSADDQKLQAMIPVAEIYGLTQTQGGAVSPLGKLQQDQANLQQGDPRRGDFDKAIEKATAGPVPPDPFDNEGKLRGEFTKLSGDFRKQNASFGRLQASANDPSAAGDLALIFNYMKILDPGSTVREGEFATAEQAGDISDRVWKTYNRILTGERLSGPQRADFYDRSLRLFSDAQDQHEQLRGHFEGLSQRNNLNPENVVIDFRVADIKKAVNTGGDFDPDTSEAVEVYEDAQGNRAIKLPDGSFKEI